MADRLSYGIVTGSTSFSLPVMLIQAANSLPETGRTATHITAGYMRQGAAPVVITVTDLGAINSAWSSGGWKEADGTARPGSYRFDIPDAAFGTGADWVSIYAKTAASYFEMTLPLVTKSPALIETSILNVVNAIFTKTNNLPSAPAATGDAMSVSAAGVAAILDLADAVETGVTVRRALRLLAATTGGKLSGAGTGEEIFRNAVADTKPRVTATVDAAGNRLSIDYDLT